ncbi:gluconate 2-dehydrogenase subunit 3 family protein [Sulfurimonas sp.]
MLLNSRRTFLKTTFLSSAVIVISGGKLFGATTPLQTLSVVQNDLFPHAKLLGANASAYISVIFHHSLVSDSDKVYLRNGVQWLNEEAVKVYKKQYIQLNPKERQNILKSISKHRWGKSWIETVMTYMVEAILGDPIYGINKNEAGWKWLNHKSGLPRPKDALL